MNTVTDGTRWRIAAVLFIAQSAISAANIAAFTLTPIIAPLLSGSNATAGIPNTLQLLGKALAAFPIGYLLDRIGRRNGLTVANIIGVGGALLSIAAIFRGSFTGFLAGAFLLGVARVGSDQSRYVAAEVFASRRRATVLGLIVSAGTVGAIGGPLLVDPSAGFMEALGRSGNSGPFVVAAVLLALATVVVFLFLRPDPREIGAVVTAREAAAEVASDPEHEAETSARPLRELFAQPAIWLAVGAMSGGFLVMVMLMVITPLHMAVHNHGRAAISGVIMAHTLGMFGLSWLTGGLVDRLGRERMIVAGGAVLLLSCLIAPISNETPMLALSLFLLGLGWNFTYVGGSTLLADQLRPTERGRMQGASETIIAVSSGIGSLSTGLIFDAGGYLLAASIGLVLSLLIIGAAIVIPARHRLASLASREATP